MQHHHLPRDRELAVISPLNCDLWHSGPQPRTSRPHLGSADGEPDLGFTLELEREELAGGMSQGWGSSGRFPRLLLGA